MDQESKSEKGGSGNEEGANMNLVEGFVDHRGDPANNLKHGGITAAVFILVMAAVENMAYLGTSVNLVTYFYLYMHYDLSRSADMVTNFMGASFLLSLVGAFISDAYLSRLKTLLVFGSIEFIGFMVLTIQAQLKSLQLPHCNMFNPNETCRHVTGSKKAVLLSGLYLVALGSGGIKGTLPILGADQFNENDPKEQRLMWSFFNFFLFGLCFGASIGVVLLVWLQNIEGWDIALSLSASLILFGLFVMALGYTKFRNRIPAGSPTAKILQVFVAAFRNRKHTLPSNPTDLNPENETQLTIERSSQFKFLDKAAIRPSNTENQAIALNNKWKICTITQVEDVKVLLRMIPIFACTILMSTCLAQLQTFSIQQGETMNRKIGKLKIASASVPIIPMFFIVILTPLYDRLFVPMARKFTGLETGITHLRRIGTGLLLSIFSMAAAAIVERKRKDVAKQHGLIHANPMLNPVPMSVFMLSFQYFIFGVADLFTFAGLLQFFYSQAPKGFRSLGTSFVWCSMSMGYFLSSVLVNSINSVTEKMSVKGGWLRGNNINLNHLDLFYWTLAVLSLINFVNYLFWAKWYRYK
ncbi:hypothetical protein Sjap_012599 [Stephania japonica]|uniref:Uncharacterized protein n=1 Tax=Stephania japonica TaxID=461633 RepID=A0AAP0IW79_9MAGN